QGAAAGRSHPDREPGQQPDQGGRQIQRPLRPCCLTTASVRTARIRHKKQEARGLSPSGPRVRRLVVQSLIRGPRERGGIAEAEGLPHAATTTRHSRGAHVSGYTRGRESRQVKTCNRRNCRVMPKWLDAVPDHARRGDGGTPSPSNVIRSGHLRTPTTARNNCREGIP